ncbi:hypothetical protein JKF63_05216 [Porcisia hertigi]|uniref:Uncharacterized protein n=1 Tax=Porcisia hertigi TaxID=2761500 RepID=A0A836LIS0_9TRYP|nr:hypothetical protein JKF63_05216 [Porcisia hertigi]
MSDQQPRRPIPYGNSVSNTQTSLYSSSPHDRQQHHRPYSNTNNNGGAALSNALLARSSGPTGGRGRGRLSHSHNDLEGRASHNMRGGERGSFNDSRLNSMSATLMQDAPRTKLSSYVTPHDAVQAQPAQHGATVVRSGSSATEGGSILFFSSVQKKGGAFTASERETYAQLHRSRAIPNVNRGRNAGNVTGSGVSAKSVARQYADLEKKREATALSQVKTTVVGARRSRFALDDSPSEEDDTDGDGGNSAQPPAKRPATGSK